jgi:tRNA A-37 threonylcarbamoyl transferase component Bud32
MALFQLPNLCWIAFSDNPFVEKSINQLVLDNSLEILDKLEQHELLGTGASGVTHRATWNGTTCVAVKTYFGEMTSDGNPRQERTLSLVASTLSSPCLIKVVGQTQNGSLVMELLENFGAFAGPPSMESCSRDVYNKDHVVTVHQAVSMVTGLLVSLVNLHEVGICHGDFYGHNILVSRDDCTKVRLSDFGAAFAYDHAAEYGRYIEKIEMRAFAHLVTEIKDLLVDEHDNDSVVNVRSALMKLVQTCRRDNCSFRTVLDLWLANAPSA